MVRKARRDDIVDHRTWSARRDTERPRALAIKKARRIHLGEVLTFLFENTDTVRCQIKEMMRVEEIEEEAAIHYEIELYDRLLGVQYLNFETGGRTPRAPGSDHHSLTVRTELSATQRAALEEDLRG